MIGWLKYDEQNAQDALDLVSKINSCMGFPNGKTETWDDVTAYCTIDQVTSGATTFWGYVVKIDTDQVSSCLTQQELSSIISLPEDVKICGS